MVTLFKMVLVMMSEDGGQTFGDIRAKSEMKTSKGKVWDKDWCLAAMRCSAIPRPMESIDD